MNWKAAFSTAIGKKLIMGATGLFLVLFLLVHCYVNAQIFWRDGGTKFNEAAHFMGNNPVIRIVEVGLFIFLIWHAILGVQLWIKNKSRRKIGYAVAQGRGASGYQSALSKRWYSRSMGILGTLILLFLIIHLRNFWAPNRYDQTFGAGEHNLYADMQAHFSNIWMVAIYVLGCISLAWHLMHGFWSSFQTFGLTTHRYKHLINSIGVGFSIIVPLIFALMPIAFYAGWLS